MLSVLPFEADWYRKHGVDVEYVGHPFFDEVADYPIREEELRQHQIPGKKTIGILPGSRKQEVFRNFPVMLDVMSELYEKHPQIQFQVACYQTWHATECQRQYEESGCQLPIHFQVGRTPEIIDAGVCCLMV